MAIRADSIMSVSSAQYLIGSTTYAFDPVWQSRGLRGIFTFSWTGACAGTIFLAAAVVAAATSVRHGLVGGATTRDPSWDPSTRDPIYSD